MNLRLELAKLEFGFLQTEDLPELAALMLEVNLDSPSLRILAGLSELDTTDIQKYWRWTTEELNIECPSRDQAAWLLIQHYIELIIEKQIDPHEGIHTIRREIYHRMDWDKKNKEYVGDSIGIQALYGLCVTFDDLKEATTQWDTTKTNEQLLNELGRQIVEAAIKYKNDYLSQHRAS